MFVMLSDKGDTGQTQVDGRTDGQTDREIDFY